MIVESSIHEYPNPENFHDLLLYTNRGLWGEITPSIRQISFKYNRQTCTYTLFTYFDDTVTQKELNEDIPGIIIAELISNFTQEIIWKDETKIIAYPQPLPAHGFCVYRRYEEKNLVGLREKDIAT
ncbi:MAG: hypothetical protein Tsb0021_08630 [Chlamydiales bacterium]